MHFMVLCVNFGTEGYNWEQIEMIELVLHMNDPEFDPQQKRRGSRREESNL